MEPLCTSPSPFESTTRYAASSDGTLSDIVRVYSPVSGFPFCEINFSILTVRKMG